MRTPGTIRIVASAYLSVATERVYEYACVFLTNRLIKVRLQVDAGDALNGTMGSHGTTVTVHDSLRVKDPAAGGKSSD